MGNTKIIAAMLFGVIGYWIMTLAAQQDGRHILISDTAAYQMPNGLVAAVFSIENTGQPDRIIRATLDRKAATINAPRGTASIIIPAGKSHLSLEAAHLLLTDAEISYDIGTLLPVELAFEKAGTVRARIKVADPSSAPILHGSQTHGAAALDLGQNFDLKLKIRAEKDGWRVEVDASNFQFSRNKVDGPHIPGVGHGHLYVSGTKIGRLYTPTAYIGQLPRGTHTVRVTLNTNNHMAYMSNGQIVEAKAVFTVD
ncbi:MAG: hypothetical protein AB8B71_06800 [Paracoccaceae bacterium]